MFIKRDKSDEMFYDDFLAESEKLQDVVKEGVTRHFAFEDINKDIFTMMYEPTPEDVEGNIPMGLKIAKQNIDKIKELREYQDLHRMTKLDPLLSGIATESMAKHFISLLPKVSEDPQQLEAKKQIAEELGMPDQAGELQAKIDAVNNYLGKVDPLVQNDDKVRQNMRAALEQAVQDTQDAQDALGAFGAGNEPGQIQQAGLKEKMELAKRLRESKKLKEIAKLAGRFSRIAKKKVKEKMISNEVSAITIGDNLARTLPSELAKLANPSTKVLFYKGYVEKNLLEYDLRNKVPQGQGPIVFLYDGSGSMNGYPEYATKAIGLALVEVAKREKRDIILGQFGSFGQYSELIIPKGEIDMLPLLAALEFFFNGGTNFERPLTEALKHITGSKYNKADIIFATDGEAEVSPEFMVEYMRVKEEKKFSCVGLLIGPEAKVLQSFCDEMFHVNDLLSDEKENADIHDRIFKI